MQVGEQNDFSVRELQRIVMSMRVVAVDLSKPRHPLLGFPVPEEPESGLVPNCLPEGQLGSRKEAYSYVRFIRRGEAAGNQVTEPGGYKLITASCRSGRNLVQTVVTHGRYSSCCNTAGGSSPRNGPNFRGGLMSVWNSASRRDGPGLGASRQVGYLGTCADP